MTRPARTHRTGGARSRSDSYDNIEPWFDKLADLDATDPHRRALREHIIELCLPLAEHIARRYLNRGEAYDDLLQTARMGLVLAVDRFDPGRGAPFLGFAVPTIMGEVRKHFRDHTWAARVPRRYKELRHRIVKAGDPLTQRLGRAPNARELAAELDVDIIDITQALVAANVYQCDSLDAARTERDDVPSTAAAALGVDEPCYELLEQAAAVRPLIADLPQRDRDILVLRFFESKTQSEIAEHFGVSQMHVSRLLTRILDTLRDGVWSTPEDSIAQMQP